MTFPDISERPGATEAPCVLCVVRGDQQGAAVRRREGSPLPVADLPTQALTEASLVPFHRQLSHCCSRSLPDNETPDWIGSEGLISTSEDECFR